MTNEPDEAMGRTELLDRIERSWVAFQATVNGLDDGQLGTTGPDGWTVKDHLVHVERWEAYMLAELGVPQSDDLGNVASYVKSWLKSLRDDASYVFKASSAASRPDAAVSCRRVS